MSRRTFAFGDLHGDIDALFRVMASLPPLTKEDTLLFVGDYTDRGPKSAQVIDYLRTLPNQVPAKVVALRGNHEDAWLRAIEFGWPEFVLPPGNGCLAALRSFTRGPHPEDGEEPADDRERDLLLSGKFFPRDVVEWMEALPLWYEDEHAVYVHAGLPPNPAGGFFHPREAPEPMVLLWCRDEAFFRYYRGKLVVFGHTATSYLPVELSSYTPEDPDDVWAGPCTIGLDTGAGKGGFLTCVELPEMRVYESR